MKVFLLAVGGFALAEKRFRIPKPMVEVGGAADHPHVMEFTITGFHDSCGVCFNCML